MPRTTKPMTGPCEMSTGVEYPKPPTTPGVSWGSPVIIKCHQPGVERRDILAVVGSPIVCDPCYAAWLAKRVEGR